MKGGERFTLMTGFGFIFVQKNSAVEKNNKTKEMTK